MSVDLLSDLAFVEKLESVAGITNDHLLSDREILHGRDLLQQAREKLCVPGIDAEEERRLIMHISLLSIAVAPHKRIPLEVLKQIFLAYNSSMDSKHSLGQGPWRIGQVCRAWRELSRSMRDLWGTTELNLASTKSSPRNTFNIGLDILPPIARTRVHAEFNEQIFRNELVPNLSRVDDLLIYLTNGDEQRLWDMFPHHALSRIDLLELGNFSGWGLKAHPPPRKSLFGPNPRLKTLSLISQTPDILCRDDLPWDRIIQLRLRIYPGDPAHWMDLRTRQTFSAHARLRHLDVQMTDDLIPVIFSWNIPWYQLSTFHVNFQSQLHVPTAMKELQECTSLVDLNFKTSNKAHDWREEGCVDLDLPNLRNLTFEMWNPNILLHYLTAPLLTHLNMRSETIQLADISQFITRSQCKIKVFSLYPFDNNDGRRQVDPSIMAQLLSCLPSCTSFTLKNVVTPDSILDDIATSALLPCVEILRLSVTSVDSLLSLAEIRHENQTISGQNSLGAIHAYMPHTRYARDRQLSSAQSNRRELLMQRTPSIRLKASWNEWPAQEDY